MSKIITLTFSPSIDKSASVASIIPETKLKCSKPVSEPGGGGVNVARVLTRLGVDVTAVFPSGGYSGVYFNHLMENENVKSIIIPVKNETKENFVVLNQETNKQFRFGMPNIELLETEWKACLKAIETEENVDFIIASGSLAKGVPTTVYGELSEISKSKNAKLIIDTSGDALKNAVKQGAFLVKPNIEELGLLLGIKGLKIENVEVAAKNLIAINNIEIVVVSLGADGAILVTKNETHHIKPPKVDVKSTVGAGDSMVAGLVFGLSKKLDLKSALQYGIACGTATTMNLGSALCDKKTILELLEIIKSQ